MLVTTGKNMQKEVAVPALDMLPASGEESLYLSARSSLRAMPLRSIDRKKLSRRTVEEKPSPVMVATPSPTPERDCQEKKTWRCLADFIEYLKDQSGTGTTGVIDLISGREGKSVLKRLYESDSELALDLVKQHLEAFEREFDDPELQGVFEYEKGSQAQQDIAAMLHEAGMLGQNGVNPQGFDDLLHLLGVFEEQHNRVPYEQRCDIALLKRAGVASQGDLKALPESMKKFVYSLLDPEDVSPTARGILLHYDVIDVTDFVQDACNTQGRKLQQSLLQKTALGFFRAKELDFESFTLDENIRRLCDSHPEKMYSIVRACFKEQARKGINRENPLQGYDRAEDRCSFLKNVFFDDSSHHKEMKDEVSRHLLAIHEKCLLEQMARVGRREDGKWFDSIVAFTRMADACDYQTGKKIRKERDRLLLLEMDRQTRQGEQAIPPLWMLKRNHSIRSIRESLEADCPDRESASMQALKNFVLASRSTRSVEEVKQMLQAKDVLIKTQIEALFQRAREQIDCARTVPESDFKATMAAIATLEAQRPPESLLKEKQDWTTMISGIGHRLLRGGEVPVDQRLRDMYLEYQLAHHFSYDFKNEVTTYLSSVPGQLVSAVGAVAEQAKKTVALVCRTVSGSVPLSEAFRQSLSLTQGTSCTLLDTVKKDLEDYATLCMANPHLARMLAGNIAQTVAVIENTVGAGSELYNIFNQFQKRVGMETMAIRFVEEFSPQDADISSLNPEQAAALKRMFALCQLFQWAPEAVTGVTGAAQIASKTMAGSVTGAGWAAIKTVFRVASAHAVKQGVSALSDEEVKGVNTAIMALRHGPEEAARRLQAMETAVEFVADRVKGHTFAHSSVKALFRPLTIRFFRVKKAWENWRNENKSILPLVSELVKVTAIVAPVAGSLLVSPLVAILSGPAVAGYVFLAGPLAALSFIRLFYATDPYEDMAKLVSGKVSAWIAPDMDQLVRQAKRQAGAAVNAPEYERIKKQMAYESLYTRFWPDFSQKNRAVAQELEQEIARGITKEAGYQERLEKMRSMARELAALERLLEGDISHDAVVAALDDDGSKDQVPADARGTLWWTMGRVQQHRNTLFTLLGTGLIPVDDEALEARFRTFHLRIAMTGYMMQQNDAVAQAMPHALGQAENQAREIIERQYEKAAIACVRSVATRAVFDRQASQNGFTGVSNPDKKTMDAIAEELGVMRQVFTNMTKNLPPA